MKDYYYHRIIALYDYAPSVADLMASKLRKDIRNDVVLKFSEKEDLYSRINLALSDVRAMRSGAARVGLWQRFQLRAHQWWSLVKQRR